MAIAKHPGLRRIVACVAAGLAAAPILAHSGHELARVHQSDHHRFHALIVGIDTYPNAPAAEPRRGNVEAAKLLGQAFVKSYGFSSADVTVLTDARASRKAITQALAKLQDPKGFGPDDSLVVVLACGLYRRESVGLLPSDGWSSPTVVPTGIPLRDFWHALERCPCRDVLVAADFAGLTLPKQTGEASSQFVELISAGDTKHPAGESQFLRALVAELDEMASRDLGFLAWNLYQGMAQRLVSGFGERLSPAFASNGGRAAFKFLPGGLAGVEQQVISTVDIENVDVRDAIRGLFKHVNANYVIAPEVQGTVTVTLLNAKFELALRTVLDQVGATYLIEAGVFTIVKRE